MRKIIIADTSCLIVLEKIGHLDLLNQVFGEILITQKVFEEFGKNLPNWIWIKEPKINSNREILEITLDRREASSIALAMEYEEPLLIMDEIKGRKIARGLNIKVTGTLGILIMAKSMNTVPTVKPILEKIKFTNFRISPELEELILVKCKEK
jgi:predicted nucleic acid-binding protein